MSEAGTSAIWHDVECGAYEADLRLWEDLADEASGPILDLGCGTGRVALPLARGGHQVVGLDAEASVVKEFNLRAGELPAVAHLGDARDFSLDTEFGLAIAPMQLAQLFASRRDRIAFLHCMADHLRPGGRAALAIAEAPLGGASSSGPRPGADRRVTVLPDSTEVDGWAYSSLPLETVIHAEEIVLRRLRQVVSPQGELSDEVDEVRLQALDAATVEREAARVGLRSAGRRAIPATEAHVGSTAVLLERRP